MTGDSAAFCPHCGYDLARDAIVSDGDYTHDPRFGVFYRGERLSLPPGCHHILGSLMREQGRPVTRNTLAERLGYEGERPDNLIAVRMAAIRNHFRARKLPCPVQNTWSVGLWWVPQDHREPLEAAA